MKPTGVVRKKTRMGFDLFFVVFIGKNGTNQVLEKTGFDFISVVFGCKKGK